MRVFLCFIVVLLCGSDFSSAQKTCIVYGKITDQETGMPVDNAPVHIENTTHKTYSNRHGYFYLTMEYRGEKQSLLTVNDLRYDISKKIIVWQPWVKSRNDSLEFNFQLQYRSLPDFTFIDAPEKIHGSTQYHVSDYEFSGNKLLLLVYDKSLEKDGRLLLCDDNKKMLYNMKIPDEAVSFYRDFQDGIHIVCRNKVYAISVYDSTVGLLPSDITYFEDYIKPLVDTGNSSVYFSSYNPVYPAFDYYAWMRSDSSYRKLHHLVDEPLMELYRAQYKYVDGRDKLEAYRAELRTGIDKEIWVALWSGFPQSIYYKPLYAPMFLKDDTVLVFDHYSNRIYRFNHSHQVIDSIEINYHTGKSGREWEKQLIIDTETKIIYGVFQRGGRYYLKTLNTQTGEISAVHPLRYAYPENIKVKGSWVYYIYRPFESSQNKFLYRERLNN